MGSGSVRVQVSWVRVRFGFEKQQGGQVRVRVRVQGSMNSNRTEPNLGTLISHKVVVNAESLLYVISNKKYCFINIYIFFLLRFVFVCAVVRITNQTNKYVTHQITLQIKPRCSKLTNQIAFKDGQTDGKFLII